MTAQPPPRKLPRGRHGLPRQLVVRSQRERMLEATVRAVSELGYHGLTVAAILGRAGVSRKTFYEHFADREACFLAAYDEVVERLDRRVAEAFATGETWPDRLRSGLAAFLGFLAAEPALARMCIVEVLAAGPGALRRRDAAMRRFQACFEPGREAARGGPPPRLVGEAAVGAIHEVVYARVLRDRTEELPGLLDDLTEVVLAPFLGDEAAHPRAPLPR